MAVLAAAIASATPALADMGTSPVGPGGMYLNLFGGYLTSDGPETVGHITTPATVNGPNPHVTVGAEEGGFVGGTAGYVLGGTPLFGLQNMRVEAAISALILDKDVERSAPNSASIHDLNRNSTATNQTAVSRQSGEVYDYSVTLKGDAAFAGTLAAALGVELFLRRSSDKTSVISLNAPFFRTHEVDALFYGAMAVLQPEFTITPAFSVVADLGAGIYGVNADADSATNLGAPATFNDSGSTVGFRGRAMGGLRWHMMDGVSVTAFGGVDYWSDAPFANQTSIAAASGPLPTVAFDDLVELKAGLMLTWALGPQPN
jgi:hypothetical protein